VALFKHYRQFEGLSEEEVNAGKRAEAAERRAKALEKLPPLDLSSTTWPEVPPHTVVNAITYAARRGLHRYLDRRAIELRRELAGRHGVPESQLVVGEGVASLLVEASLALLEAGDEVVTPWPSYGLYPEMARRARAAAVPVPGFTTELVLRAITERTRLVVLCNPNDPTGELLRADDLRALLEALPERVVVLLDEALRDFVDVEDADAALRLVADHPRLLVFRSFSKAWGLAGLRVGYTVGGPGAEPLLERLEPELGLNELAQAGALEALRGHPNLARGRAERVAEERARVVDALREHGYAAPAPHANVVWIRRDGLTGAALHQRLEQLGIITAAGTRVGDADHVRLAVPHRPELTDRLLRSLQTIADQPR
jgi:histidinol-phosphate aminotransferase